jgi:hypothetical protein
MNATAPGILEDFIASEDEALVQCKQGDFYPPNHHLIKPLVFSATTLLSDDARQRLYFHLLRVGELPPARSAHEFGLLSSAYAQMVPLLAQGFPMCSLQRALGLLAFGYDDRGALPGEPAGDAESFQYHARVWAQCNAYTAIPYMIDKAEQFALYAEDGALARRIHKLLRHSKYIHSEIGNQEARYPITRLWFWGLVFIALLHADTATGVVEDFLAPTAKLPRYHEQLRILGRYLEGAQPDLRARVMAAAGAALS